MSRYLGRRTCHICKQEISNAGGGYQHFMAHVRRGEAIKIPMRWGTFVFRPTPKDGAEKEGKNR